MEIHRLHYPDNFQTPTAGPFSLAIGFFDGLHIGHQTVIEAAKRKAEELGIQSAVMTFDPHPSHLFKSGADKVGYITPYREKIRLLQDMGIDTLFIVTFNWELASLSPEAFVELFMKGLGVKHLTAGFDFTFGSKGSGTMEQMAALADGVYETTIIPKVEADAHKISSTRIRELLAQGDVEHTARLLGRPFRTVGTVIHGDKRGRQLGFPTANIASEPESLIPSNGVYAVRVLVGTTWYDGVCNVGVKPTFHDPNRKTPTVEVHIMDFEGSLYDQELSLEWIAHIRSEKKFQSIEELIEQIGKDKHTAKQLLHRRID